MTNEGPQPIARIVVFTLDSLQSAIALHRLMAALGPRVVAIVASQRYGGKYGSFWSQTRRNHARSGAAFVTYLGLQMVWFHPMAAAAGLVNRLAGRPAGISRLSSLARRHGVPVIRTTDPNGDEVVRRLKSVDADLFVSAYFDHVIRPPLLALPRAGVVNIHPALLPDLRGPFPGLWAMIRGHDRVGVTVHRITDETLDTGPILAQREVPHDPAESVLALDCRLMRAGAALAVETIQAMERGEVSPVPQAPHAGFYDSFPTRGDLEILRRRGKRLWSFADVIRPFFSAEP